MVLLYKVYKIKGKSIVLLSVLLILIIVITNYSTSILKCFYPVKFKESVVGFSMQYGVDPYLTFAIIRAESGFKLDAVSSKNASGLMQIADSTAEWATAEMGYENYKPADLFDPEKNIQIGCWYLRWLIDNLGDIDLAIAAYNGGIGNVKEWLKNRDLSSSGLSLDKIPFRETEKYVEKVKNNYYVYKKIYNE